VLIFIDFQKSFHTIPELEVSRAFNTTLFFNFSFFMSISHDMIEKITPLSDRVLLKPVEADKVTASGIIIPDSANKERPSVYEVIAIGPGKIDKNGQEIKIDLKKWDRVISGQYSGDDVKVGDTTYKIVAFEYILAKIS
jgi:chaperonin GroES